MSWFHRSELVVLYWSKTPPRSLDGPTPTASGHPRLDQRHRGSEGRLGRSLPVPRSRRRHSPDDQERVYEVRRNGRATQGIQELQRGTSGAGALSPTSTFAQAAELYLAKVARKREDTTLVEYRARLDNYVLPALGALRLRECTVAQLDRYFDALSERYSANTRRSVRTVVVGVMRQAVIHGAIDSNPAREIERIEQTRGKRKAGPRGLTVDERRAMLEWLDSSSPDPAVHRLQRLARRAELPDLVRFFLGTGLRIGEGLAIRRLDIDLAGAVVRTSAGETRVPVLAVAENLVWVKGKGLIRHEGKSGAALRLLPLPSFAVEVIEPRLQTPGEPHWPLFPTSGLDARSPTAGRPTSDGPCAASAKRSGSTG